MRKPRMTKLGQGVEIRAHYPTLQETYPQVYDYIGAECKPCRDKNQRGSSRNIRGHSTKGGII